MQFWEEEYGTYDIPYQKAFVLFFVFLGLKSSGHVSG
jgi:hypothetical protein